MAEGTLSAIPAMATIHDNDILEVHPSRSHLAMNRSLDLPFFLDFESYVGSLPDSDQRLLEHVYFYMGPF
jgi:hypothetical protein